MTVERVYDSVGWNIKLSVLSLGYLLGRCCCDLQSLQVLGLRTLQSRHQ